MEVITLVEWVTQAATLLMIGSGIPPCVSMYKTGRTDSTIYLFCLLGMINSVCFFAYGLLMSNTVLIFLNSVGVVVQGGCILTYLAVVKLKLKPLLLLCSGLAYLVVLYCYLTHVVKDEDKIPDQLGFYGGVVSFVMLSTPFLEIADCLNRKSTEGMSLVMLVGATACSSCWYLYGNMLNDPYIYIPNIPGVVSGLGKFALLWWFSSTAKMHTN